MIAELIMDYLGVRVLRYSGIQFEKIAEYRRTLYIKSTNNSNQPFIFRYKIEEGLMSFFIPMVELDVPIVFMGKNLSKQRKKMIRALLMNPTKKELAVYLLEFIECELISLARNNLAPVDFIYRSNLYVSFDALCRILDGYHIDDYRKLLNNRKLWMIY